MRDVLIFCGFAVALSAVVSAAILYTPVVQINTKGNCVAVFSPSGEYSCGNLPAKYSVERVK